MNEIGMTEVEGVVKCLDGTFAEIEVVRASGCGRCHEPGGCGGGGLERSCRRVYRLPNAVHAAVGDTVMVAISEGSVLKAASLAYGLPGGMMLLGAGLANFVSEADFSSLLGAVLGLTFGYCLLRLHSAYFGNFQSLSIRRLAVQKEENLTHKETCL